MSTPAQPDAAAVIATLQRFTRSYFEHAASLECPEATRMVFDEIGTTLARCNPARWSDHARDLPASTVADQIAASIALALRDIDPATPHYSALDRVRQHIGCCGR